jgi:hypothetical protein
MRARSPAAACAPAPPPARPQRVSMGATASRVARAHVWCLAAGTMHRARRTVVGDSTARVRAISLRYPPQRADRRWAAVPRTALLHLAAADHVKNNETCCTSSLLLLGMRCDPNPARLANESCQCPPATQKCTCVSGAARRSAAPLAGR